MNEPLVEYGVARVTKTGEFLKIINSWLGISNVTVETLHPKIVSIHH